MYSAGPAIGSHRTFKYEEDRTSYVRYRYFDEPSDVVLGRDRVAAEYMDEDAAKVVASVSTTGPISPEVLKDSLAALKPMDTAVVKAGLGMATVATLADGSSLALLPLDDATIAIYSADRKLVLEALAGLKKMR